LVKLVEVITNQEVRLNGNSEPAEKLVQIPESLLPIWLGIGLCRLPGEDKPAEEEAKPEAEVFPKSLGFGNYQLSNGETVKGKQKAIEAEEALKVTEENETENEQEEE
jgi:hypothetical protein